MLGSLLKLFGCSSPNKKTDKKSNTDSTTTQILESVEKFKNRAIYSALTSEIIDSTSDDELLQTVFDNLIEKLPKDYLKEYQAVTGWTKEQQAIYIIWIVETEVNNGGFNQFYFNSSGQFAHLAPDAFKLVGANRFAELMIKANRIYQLENKRITKEQDGTLEGFSKSYENNPLNKLDEEFYHLYKEENLQSLQVDFIRKNRAFFIDK